MYQQRALAPILHRALLGFPAILLTGPRQSGKTTFLRHEAGEQSEYVSFDDPLERDFAAVDPAGFLDRFVDRPVILDEIQYVPVLLSHLKMRIDKEPGRCGRWLLTGSQQFSLMRDISESLAGRVAILELPPFSHAEFARPELEDVLWNGGYPIPAMHPDRRDLWLRGYVSTYIERDVRQIRNIPDLAAFNQFLSLVAARHSQEFHPADLSRELGVTQPTVKSWGGVLEASYVSYFLPPWSRNYGKRVVKTPKFYFYDAALVTLLTRQPNAIAALAGPMGGPLLEGWVVTESVKAFMSVGRKPELYFWRSHDGLEVDLLIVINGKLQPVEIKLTATPGAGHVEPINRFLSIAGEEAGKQGLIVCRTESERALPNGHMAIPWHAFSDWLRMRLIGAVV
jgi:predicted AAA+ superfamily ATPase